MASILLLILVWPVSPTPILFCQNTERQIESILSLLQTITTSINQTNLRESKSNLNIDQCTLTQRLTNYQACDLPQMKEITYMKVETKGLVDNLQSFKSAGCVLSPATCPYSDMAMWPKINTVLENWSRDVAACKNELKRMCLSLKSV